MNALRKIRKVIDTVNFWVGTVAKFLLIAILFCLSFEVIARYVFNSPTIWAMDMSLQFLCALGALGGAYALLFNQHVRVDVFWGSWSVKTRAIVDLFTSVLFFIFMCFMVYQTVIMAQDSWMFQERMASVFAPPLYYVKTLIPIGSILLLLQGVSKLFHDIIAVATGESEDMRYID